MDLDCATELRLGPPGSSTATSCSGDQAAGTKRPSAKRTLDDSRSEASGTGPAAVDDDQDTTTAAK
jgi:auxin-responsive protein IAA